MWLTDRIERFVLESADNNLADGSGEPAWARPLVGFSSGADPLYRQYKLFVGPFHWTPADVFGLSSPGEVVPEEQLAVVSWVLPQTEATKADNRAETFYPAERWARARIFGEAFNNVLRRQVVDLLQAAGYPAVAPMLSPHWESVDSPEYVYASTWSERHAAYASGLGTFGLCDGMITPLGKAVRFGSVVTRAPLAPTPRPYDDHRAYCLLFSHGTCGKCISRCPAGALTREGHDKRLCSDHTGGTCREYVRSEFGFEGYGCGLCQTGVPCESGIPLPADG
jgi:epoxyqueuosine reductase QueG